MGKKEIIALLACEDYDGLAEMARLRTSKVLRYLTGRLCSADEAEKQRAVRALGVIVGTPGIIGRRRIEEQLRRYFWLLNDESGAVPFGVPEAIGEILAVRPECQEDFLPLLCAMITHEDMIQTGPIERGVIWALGRIGEPVRQCSPQAVQGIAAAAAHHGDPATRHLAGESLGLILGTKRTDASGR